MSTSRAFFYMLGAVLVLIAMYIGIHVYSTNPGDTFYWMGHDELEHREFGRLFVEGKGLEGILLGVLGGESITGGAGWGNGLVIGLSEYFFGSQLAFFVVKAALHLLATYFLYELLRKYRNEQLAVHGSLFFLIYPPLLVYATSFMKDDLVASLVIITAALFDRRHYLLLVLLVPLMIAVRPNTVLFPVILLAYLRRSSIRYLLLLSIVPIASALFIVSQGYFSMLQNLLSLPIPTIFFFVVKYLVGPLPNNILNYDTEQAWIFPWYLFSFCAIVASFFLSGFYSSIYRNWFWILALLAVALGPYLPYVFVLDIVGPRQFASVGWMFFLMFYEVLLSRYKFSTYPVSKSA